MAKRKRRLWRFSDEFRSAAVQRVQNGEKISAVARDIDVHRQVLRGWLHPGERAAKAEVPVAASPGEAAFGREEPQKPALAERSAETPVENATHACALRRENQQLKEALAEKTLEVDFFRGALQKIEARRQPSNKAGETAFTPRSGR